MKGKLIFILALPIVLYLGAKIYLHLHVKGVATFIAQAMYPLADIEFDRATSSIDGNIGITKVRIYPRDIDDQILIDEISITLPDMWYTLNLRKNIESNNIPERFSMQVKGLRLNANGKLLQALDDAIYADDPVAMVAAYRSDCPVRVSKLASQQYLLGYDEVNVSLQLGYTYDKERRVLSQYIAARQQGAADLKLTLENTMPRLDVYSLADARNYQMLHGAELEIVDRGYFTRLLKHCGDADGSDHDDILMGLMDRFRTYFQTTPMNPSETTVENFRRFIVRSLNGQQTRFVASARPVEPRNLEYMTLYNRNDVERWLNITTHVN